MKPSEAMIAASRRALDWYTAQPDADLSVESWQLRFARSVEADKAHATVSRVVQWFAKNERPSETASPADRLAWDLLGGEAGAEWALDAVEQAPNEEMSLMSTIDRIESEADERDLAEFVEGGIVKVQRSGAEWYVPLSEMTRWGRFLTPTLPSPRTSTMRVEDWASPEAFAAFEGRKPEWSGTLMLEGVHTSDNRIIMEGATTWRELPITLQDQLLSQPGHDGAVAVGPVIAVERRAGDDGGNIIFGEGLFDSGDEGQAARRRMEEGTRQGVSVDLTEVILDLPEDEDELMEVLLGGGELRIISARIGAATLVSIPAFEGARLQITGDMGDVDTPALVASGGKLDGVTLNVLTPISFAEETPEPIRWASISTLPKGMYPSEQEGDHEHHLTEIADEPNSLAGEIDDEPARTTPVGLVDAGEFTYTTEYLDALIASGAKFLAPPAEWFEQQRYSEASPKTIEAPNERGLIRIHGHVGVFGSCHIGRDDVCIDVPRGLDYDSFQGPKVESDVLCADGTTLKAGPIVLDNVHPKLRMKASDAAAHYAYSGSLVAQVRCYEDQIGLQVQGWVLPGVTEEDLVRLRALSLSPDWRPRATANGGQGVVAILAVPVTGFNMGLAASAGAAGEPEPELEAWEVGREVAKRKVGALAAIGVDAPPGLVALAEASDPPLVAARKTAVLARLSGSCGCGGECCGA